MGVGHARDQNVRRVEARFHEVRCHAGSLARARAHCLVDPYFLNDSRRGSSVSRGRRASPPVPPDDRRSGRSCPVALSGEFLDG